MNSDNILPDADERFRPSVTKASMDVLTKHHTVHKGLGKARM